MKKFLAYGLTIESEIRAPGLPLSNNLPQVTVHLAQVAKPAGDPNAERIYAITLGEFRIFWRGVGTFLIRKGNEIFIEPEPGVEEALIRLYLLGPALTILLGQRGILTLHASVVNVDGLVVGFMGEKGWGKSTTAAALNAKGHALVADDILAIDLGTDGIPMVQPGPAHFKLWPDSVSASFGDDPNKLDRLCSQIEKRVRSAITSSLQEPLMLRQLYVLDLGTKLESVPMPATVALMILMRHCMLSRVVHEMGMTKQNFDQCVQLAQKVPISFLKRPRDLNALGNIVELVENDLSLVRDEMEQVAMAAT